MRKVNLNGVENHARINKLFFIDKKDVQFIRHEKDAYILANLTTNPSESRLDGLVKSSLNLFKVSDPMPPKINEPESTIKLEFLLSDPNLDF